ncbi:MAG TPA: ChbG/HpnK family deacetylase [Pseudolabrys sp.]|nr:ChbG/HpnK family deacetylase [Pseudolabrys sp.]
MTKATRHIWLCADDYGISPAVDAGIRELILRGRLNATSVMMPAAHLSEDEVDALEQLNSGKKRVAIGLHVTLTGPFSPMSERFAPLREGRFLPHQKKMRGAILRQLQPELLVIEIATQLRAFIDAFGHAPDFVDGHQHVHLVPQVRGALLKVVSEIAPTAWVRQCGRASGARRLRDSKALTLDVLSLGFKNAAGRCGVATNPAFAGAYDFNTKTPFAKIFPRFLAGLPDGGLVMCHPGHVDAELEALDPLTHQRAREFAYFNSAEFPRVLAEHGLALAQP